MKEIRPNVLIIRSSDRAKPLRDLIDGYGMNSMALPIFNMLPCDELAQAIRTGLAIHQADCIVFTSVTAVQFAQKISGFFDRPFPMTFAIGPATEEALKQAGIADIHLPPNVFSTTGLLQAPFFSVSQIQHRSVIIIGGSDPKPELLSTLKTHGANVRYLSCYQRQPCICALSIDEQSALLDSTDIIVCLSQETLLHLINFFDASVYRLLFSRLFIVPTLQMADLLRDRGIKKAPLIAANPDINSVLAVLLAWKKEAEHE